LLPVPAELTPDSRMETLFCAPSLGLARLEYGYYTTIYYFLARKIFIQTRVWMIRTDV
jgi:hypothetical protein